MSNENFFKGGFEFEDFSLDDFVITRQCSDNLNDFIESEDDSIELSTMIDSMVSRQDEDEEDTEEIRNILIKKPSPVRIADYICTPKPAVRANSTKTVCLNGRVITNKSCSNVSKNFVPERVSNPLRKSFPCDLVVSKN